VDTPTPTPTPRTDLALVKSDQPDPVVVGGTLTYTVTVTNISQVTAENAVVTDQMPAAVDLISATPSQGSCAGAICNLGTILPGQGAVIQYVVKVKDGAPSVFTNVACVATSTPESNMANNCDDEDTHVPTPTPIQLTATPRQLPVSGGLPGQRTGDSGGQMVVVIGLALLLAGGFVAAVARRRAASNVE
jgi:uncharacterized repeat protein (TIGR01451 family)/LPXTG-motif cell wall-anchored protein